MSIWDTIRIGHNLPYLFSSGPGGTFAAVMQRKGAKPVSTDGDLPQNLPLFLTDSDVAKLSDWAEAIGAVRAAYGAADDEARTPGRIFAQSTREWLRIMPSVPGSARLFGAKSIAGSFADGLRVSYLISL